MEEMKPTKPTVKRISKKKLMLSMLRKTYGIVSESARKAKCDRTQHYEWLKNDPDYAAKVAEINESFLDFGETQLVKNMKKGSDAAVIFFLKTKAKSRGYVEKIDFGLPLDNMNEITVSIKKA
jgi:hypothetical protein